MSAGTAYALLGAAEGELNSADVIMVAGPHAETPHAADAAAVFARHPGCLLVVHSGPDGCRIASRTGEVITVAVPPELHLAAADLVHDRVAAGLTMDGIDAVEVAEEARRHRVSPPLRRGRREAA